MAFRAGGIVRFEISNDYVAHRTAAAKSWFAWTEIAAIPVAALSMLSLTLAFAAEPLAATCNPASALPYFGASLAFLVAADLLFAPRRPWSRSRNNAAMNVTSVGALLVVIFSAISAGWYGWSLLYPLLIFPLSLVIAPVIGFGPLRRIPMRRDVREPVIMISLILGTALIVFGHHGYQAQIACHWAVP